MTRGASWPRIVSLPYRADHSRAFAYFAGEPGAVWLDSGAPDAQAGIDLLAAWPTRMLVCWGGLCDQYEQGVVARRSTQDPFAILRQWLHPAAAAVLPEAWPFAGGLIGYWGYDLGWRWQPRPVVKAPSGVPDLAMGVYDWAVVVDHAKRTSSLIGLGADPQTLRRWDFLCRHFSEPPPPAPQDWPRLRGRLHTSLDYPAYARRFQRLQRWIADGDCYQVNLTRAFSQALSGSVWPLYPQWRQCHHAPYGAYLHFPGLEVMSASPELFLRLERDQVTTRPIKGTRPRGHTEPLDQQLAYELLHSDKDRAENLMIVDLLRSDLGKVCAVGSVRVPELFAVESFPGVHHLVSTVQGRLAPGRDALDVLRACFPGGSVTGAPKRRAMEIIDVLEPHARGLYCGAMGYLDHRGHLNTSIPIRTLVHHQGQLSYWSGGGIVADSQVDGEFQETEIKARPLYDCLRIIRDGRPPVRP